MRLDMQGLRQPLSLGEALSDRALQSGIPAGSEAFRDALQIINKAAHAVDVPLAKTDDAVAVATRFLADLKAL